MALSGSGACGSSPRSLTPLVLGGGGGVEKGIGGQRQLFVIADFRCGWRAWLFGTKWEE